MSFKVEEYINGVAVGSHPVNIQIWNVFLTVGQTANFHVLTTDGKLPDFDLNNPPNWNHTNLTESLTWNGKTGRGNYVANVAGQDSLAVTFTIDGYIHELIINVTIT